MQGSEAITGMVRRIVESVDPDRVLVYGSYAHNRADAESDVDFFLIFRELPDRRDVVRRAYEALVGTELPKDLVVATEEEFERYRKVASTIHSIVHNQGYIVYERG
jgi:predicted nucleotidyltransferase